MDRVKCKINAGHVAVLQALAVVCGVVGILLAADATYDDIRFNNYIEKGQVWARNGQFTRLDKVKWVQKMAEFHRGKLDWYFVCTLILITLTHIVLVLNLMHEISLARRNEEVFGLRPRFSVTTAVTTAACIVATDANPQPEKPKPASAPSSSIHAEGQSILKGSAAQASISSEERAKVEAVRVQLKRREEYAKLFAISSGLICALALLVVSGLGLEIKLVKQIDNFYVKVGNNSETSPFPGICSMAKRVDFIMYLPQGDNDPSKFGICNGYLLKLSGVAVSILIVLISLMVAALYAYRYRKLMKSVRAARSRRESIQAPTERLIMVPPVEKLSINGNNIIPDEDATS